MIGGGGDGGDLYGLMMVVAKDVQLLHSHLSDTTSTTNNTITPHPHHHKHYLLDGFQEFFWSREVGEFVSGALAGAMTKAVLAPLETIRTRMVVGVGSKNIYGCYIQVIEQHGWQGLWAGNTINMLRIIPTKAIELGTFECFKQAMTSAQEKWIQTESPKLRIGNLSLNLSLSWLSPVAVAGAGVVSTLACHPLEVLKDRLTISPEVYPSLSVAVHKMYTDGGLGALYNYTFNSQHNQLSSRSGKKTADGGSFTR